MNLTRFAAGQSPPLCRRIQINKLKVSITQGCIVNETNQTTTAYDAMVVPSNQWMSGNAAPSTWWFNGRINVDGKIRETCGNELIQIIQQMKSETQLQPNQTFLPPGTVRITAAPNLNLQHLIHTVGPSTTSTSKTEEIQLEETYTTCFQTAETLKVHTLLMPAISTGVFRMPFDLCAKAAIRALEKHRTCHLQKINFVLLEKSGAEIFFKEFNKSSWKKDIT